VSEPPGPPTARALEAIDADTWARLLPHLRRALHGLEGPAVTPVVERLRAAPTSRLVTGRSRRDLCQLVSAGGPLWEAVVARLRELDPAADEHVRLRWLVDGEDPPSPASAAPRGPGAADPTSAEGLGSAGPDPELARLRERLRGLRAERDQARRRAEGEAARAASLARELADLRQRLTVLADERDAAVAAHDEATAERARVVERERRRHETHSQQLQAEVAALRRADEARRAEQRRRDQRRQDAARERERGGRRGDVEDGAGAPFGFLPGRPSRLPPDVAAGTTEAAELLLHPGRLVLVDGYNVTLAHRPQLDLEGQRSWLVQLLARLAVRRRIRPRVVFDGERAGSARPGPAPREVAVRFTGVGITADDELVLDVEATDEPVTVVTDDRELTRRLEASGADVIRSRALLGVAT
jgi:hypothetical protein